MSRLWALLSQRNLIGSDIAIILTCFLHFYEAASLLCSISANGSIGMGSLLSVFHLPALSATVLAISGAIAISAEWQPGLSRHARFYLLLPQFLLLCIEAFGALYFVASEHYADCAAAFTVGVCHDMVYRSWNFIFCDQMMRIGMPIWYGSAILARVRD